MDAWHDSRVAEEAQHILLRAIRKVGPVVEVWLRLEWVDRAEVVARHEGKMLPEDWCIKVTATHQTSLNRQMTEAVRISREPSQNLLNSKLEFSANNLPELMLKYGGTVIGDGGQKRKRGANETENLRSEESPQMDQRGEDFSVTPEVQQLRHVLPRQVEELRQELPHQVDKLRQELPQQENSLRQELPHQVQTSPKPQTTKEHIGRPTPRNYHIMLVSYINIRETIFLSNKSCIKIIYYI